MEKELKKDLNREKRRIRMRRYGEKKKEKKK